MYTPFSRVFKIKLLGSQSCLTHPAKNSHPTLTQSLISELSQLILILDKGKRSSLLKLGESLKFGQMLSRNICWEPMSTVRGIISHIKA